MLAATVPPHYATPEIMSARAAFSTAHGLTGRPIEVASGWLEHVEVYRRRAGGFVVVVSEHVPETALSRPEIGRLRAAPETVEVAALYGGGTRSFAATFTSLPKAKAWLRRVGGGM
jgi:hypothetical protein